MEVLIDGIGFIPDPFISGNSENDCERALNSFAVHTEFSDIYIREYLKKLLVTLWDEALYFSGKRPFGKVGWEMGLIYSLVECGFIPGSFDRDEDGNIEYCHYDEQLADKKVKDLIQYVFYGSGR